MVNAFIAMKHIQHTSEEGFIPLLLTVLFIVLVGIVLVYLRVMKAQH